MATNLVDYALKSGSSASSSTGLERTLFSLSRAAMTVRCGMRLAITICTSSATGLASALVVESTAVALPCTWGKTC